MDQAEARKLESSAARRYRETFRAAVARGPVRVPIPVYCECVAESCECEPVWEYETRYSPRADAEQAIWGDLYTLALARRFDGVRLRRWTERRIAAIERANGGSPLDLTHDEIMDRMTNTIDAICKAMGVDLAAGISSFSSFSSTSSTSSTS